MRNLSKFLIYFLCLLFFACSEGDEEITPEDPEQIALENEEKVASDQTSGEASGESSGETSGETSTNKFATDMLAAVNKLRSEGCTCGTTEMPPVDALKWNNALEAAAERHAKDMEDNEVRSHKGSDDSRVSNRAKDAGYEGGVGENIGWDWTKMEAIMDAWQGSPSHCKNMMDARYKDFGAARVGNNWVQVFGIPK